MCNSLNLGEGSCYCCSVYFVAIVVILVVVPVYLVGNVVILVVVPVVLVVIVY